MKSHVHEHTEWSTFKRSTKPSKSHNVIGHSGMCLSSQLLGRLRQEDCLSPWSQDQSGNITGPRLKISIKANLCRSHQCSCWQESYYPLPHIHTHKIHFFLLFSSFISQKLSEQNRCTVFYILYCLFLPEVNLQSRMHTKNILVEMISMAFCIFVHALKVHHMSGDII